MAFTATERAKIAHFLGWPADHGATLDAAILNVEADVERTILVRAEIARVDDVLVKLDEIPGTTAKAVQVGSLQLRAPYQAALLMRIARRAIVSIAAALGIESINRDIFAPMLGPNRADFYA